MFKIEKSNVKDVLTIRPSYADPNGEYKCMSSIKVLMIHKPRAKELLEALVVYFTKEEGKEWMRKFMNGYVNI